jgi:hypothetical protein
MMKQANYKRAAKPMALIDTALLKRVIDETSASTAEELKRAIEDAPSQCVILVDGKLTLVKKG